MAITKTTVISVVKVTPLMNSSAEDTANAKHPSIIIHYFDTYNEINALLPPHSYQFYARIHDKSSNINENVDVYFQADPSVMKSWCTTNSYTFPYDTTDSTIEPLLFIWGCVYNTTSETITHVKAYARTTV